MTAAISPAPVAADATVPPRANWQRWSLRSLATAFLVVFVVLLEVVLLMPFVDHLADSNNTIHFTQHGFIFAGGVLLGMALRDVQRASRR